MASLVFGKYEILRRLAIGGMGEIFLARQTGMAGFDRLAILKSLLPDLAAQDKFVEQFLDEARVAAKLNHPNIVAIYEVGLWEGVYFIAMEYIHGVNLAGLLKELVKTKELLPVPVAARIIHDATVALDHAHKATDSNGTPLGIVHRDVSPQNIMVRDDGFTKVVDFGIAKAANRSSRTATGELKGKLRYMPPEQITGAELDGRSDQFALGICFWELCARRHLFRGDNPVEIFRDITQSSIPSPAKYVQDFPPELEKIIFRMLRRDPGERYPSCREAAEEIRGYLRKLPQEVAEPQVSAYIKSKVGPDIDQVIADLTPSKDNFVISLRSPTDQRTLDPATTAPSVADTRVVGTDELARPKRTWLMAGAGVAAAASLALVLTLALRTPAAPVEPGPGVGEASATDAALGVDAAASAQDPEVAPPVLEITSIPSGATVLAGNQVLGSTPVSIDRLDPGVKHTLVLEKRGYEVKELQIQLEPGQVVSEEVRLQRRKGAGTARRHPEEKPSPGPRPAEVAGDGFLTLKTTPWTKVDIDGEPHGSTPLFKVKLAAGRHTMRLINEQEGIRDQRAIKIQPGQTTKLNITLKP